MLHARGVVHRDIKPGNVFLVNGRIDQPKVIDLGLAQGDEPSGGTRLTVEGALIGTMGYLAPEQVQTEDAVDARADVFSLGCVLFKCLTGASPFKADRIVLMLAKLLHEEAPRLRDRCPEAPAALDALVARMLAKNPAERPRDGREVAADLQALADAARVPRRLLARALFVGGDAAPYRSAESSGPLARAGISATHLTPVRRRGDHDGSSGWREIDGVVEQIRRQLKRSAALHRDRFGTLPAPPRDVARGEGGGDRASGDRYRGRPQGAPSLSRPSYSIASTRQRVQV